MLLGEYEHSIDEKGRLIVPVKFRAEFTNGLVITKGFENSLFLFPKATWKKIAKKIKSGLSSKDARILERLFLGGAYEANLDRNGRLVVPPELRKHAEIKKEVVFLGVYSRLEIWAKEKWKAYKAEAERTYEEAAEKLVAEKLIDLGI